jgi:hypothetical protein
MDAQTSNTVIAWSTAINTAVAALYAFFTWGLWRVTSRTFAESHRPYVEVYSGHERVPVAQVTSHKFTFGFKNHGAVPARMVRWDLTIAQDGATLVDKHQYAGGGTMGVGSAVFPGPQGIEVPALTEMIPVTPGDNMAVVAKVTYRGLNEKAYTTLLRMVLIMTPESVRYFFVETVIDEE